VNTCEFELSMTTDAETSTTGGIVTPPANTGLAKWDLTS